jgi:hypothetical protein
LEEPTKRTVYLPHQQANRPISLIGTSPREECDDRPRVVEMLVIHDIHV